MCTVIEESREKERGGGEIEKETGKVMEEWKHERKKKEEKRNGRMKGKGQIACEANKYGSVVCV